jgi:hypothetical protein
MRRLTSLWLAGCIGIAGCSKKEEGPPHPAAELPAPDDSPDQPSGPPPGTLPREGEAAAKPPVHVVLPGDGGTVRAPPPEEVREDAPGNEPAPGGPAGGAAPTTGSANTGAATPPPAPGAATGQPPEDLKNREWTAGNVTLKRAPGMPVTLRSVRAGQHPDFDRVVFEFDGASLPGYRLEYVDKPIIKCGSGDPTSVAGQGWLQVTLTPARGHDDKGQATVAERELKPGLPVILELERTCDFEGEVTWVLGNKGPNKYRVMELHEPTRLVVDVQH